ncbi:uncharacterized protein ARMOST_08772 [Armillaria ostoyae]|uniref:Uncharacterized protein n=1 Tax=Armillaria ostoyae TaxID=47428 RepID=A0A284R9K4_ARMOS|nr:uncharacterized protein ARMOST_08772 [Armillaria ostoyae]
MGSAPWRDEHPFIHLSIRNQGPVRGAEAKSKGKRAQSFNSVFIGRRQSERLPTSEPKMNNTPTFSWRWTGEQLTHKISVAGAKEVPICASLSSCT